MSIIDKLVRTLLNSGDSDTRVLLLESWSDDPKQKVALRPKLPALKGPKTSTSPMKPPNRHRELQRSDASQDLIQAFQGFKPPYQYNNGIHEAYFVNLVRWREPGKWRGKMVGMYQIELTGAGSHWSEKYFWGLSKAGFEEVTQHNVRGIRKRLLRAR
jgi:hypothetical protein